MEETYKRYRIYANEYCNAKYPDCNFVFYNLDDCDECMGNGISIEDCKEQINEIILNK